MKITIAVPGKFHVLNYVSFLLKDCDLQNVWFSHKPRSYVDYQLDRKFCKNLPIKEYLTQIHGRILGGFGFEEMLPIYQKIWERQVLKRWKKTDVLHVLSQGACSLLIDKARSEDSLIVAEVVNTHPYHRFDLLKNEASSRSLNFRKKELYSREKKQIEEYCAADFVLYPSEIVRSSYEKYSGFKDGAVIPYAANHRRFDLGARSLTIKKTLRIICVGQIGLRKGQLYLLEAFNRLPKGKFSLTLVGVVDDVVSDELKKYSDLFKHIVRVPHIEMPKLLHEHDIFVMPSLEEGLAVSICEAMASGLAVIATRQSGACELIHNDVNGLVIEACSSDQIFESISKLQDDEFRLQMGNAAQNSARTLNSWETYARKLSSFYSKCVS